MQSTHDITTGANQVNLACFEVHGCLYAIEVTQIREIVRSQNITPLPRAPALIEGVIELRDRVIPVVDLGRVLMGEPTKGGTAARVAVLEVDGLALGLCVDAATDVLSIDASALEDPPALVTQAGYDAVRAVVRRPDAAPVMVLSTDHILECVFLSATHAGAGSQPGDQER